MGGGNKKRYFEVPQRDPHSHQPTHHTYRYLVALQVLYGCTCAFSYEQSTLRWERLTAQMTVIYSKHLGSLGHLAAVALHNTASPKHPP